MRADFGTPPGVREARTADVLAAAARRLLNLAFVSGDLHAVRRASELRRSRAVPLVSLGGTTGDLRSALRYLLYALFGSVLYLLGAVLLYGAYGTLDICCSPRESTPNRHLGPPR